MPVTAPRRALDWPPLPDLDPTLPEVAHERAWQTLWEGLAVDSLAAMVLACLLVAGVLTLATVLAIFGWLLIVTTAQAIFAWVIRRWFDPSGFED